MERQRRRAVRRSWTGSDSNPSATLSTSARTCCIQGPRPNFADCTKEVAIRGTCFQIISVEEKSQRQNSNVVFVATVARSDRSEPVHQERFRIPYGFAHRASFSTSGRMFLGADDNQAAPRMPEVARGYTKLLRAAMSTLATHGCGIGDIDYE